MIAGLPGRELLIVAVGTEAGETIVRLDGELDISTVPQLEEALATAIGQPTRRVVLELAELSSMDARGLASIIDVRDRLGPRFGIRNARPQIRRLFALVAATQRLARRRTAATARKDQPRRRGPQL